MTPTDNANGKMLSIIGILRKMFQDSPDKSQITLQGECQRCKKTLSVNIVPTPRGFGVLGGVLTDLTPDQSYRLLCPKCHTEDNQLNNTVF